MRKSSFILILIALPYLIACSRFPVQEQSITVTPNETHESIPIPTRILTNTPTIRPSMTLSSIPTSTQTPVNTPTQEPKPFLISYTYYPDGGDDLFICLQGLGRPTFILYTDGLLVFLKDGQYWQSSLSQDDIAALFNKLSETGLFLTSMDDYSEGNNVLEVNGKRYNASSNLPDSDPLSKAFDIIFQYQPKDINEYIPEYLLLGIYKVYDIEAYEMYLPQPTPLVRNWENDPSSEYGEGWQVINGKDVPIVLAQFNAFPDYQILKKENSYYIATICAK